MQQVLLHHTVSFPPIFGENILEQRDWEGLRIEEAAALLVAVGGVGVAGERAGGGDEAAGDAGRLPHQEEDAPARGRRTWVLCKACSKNLRFLICIFTCVLKSCLSVVELFKRALIRHHKYVSDALYKWR